MRKEDKNLDYHSYIEESKKIVKKQFALYYPAVMDWIGNNISELKGYNITFPGVHYDEDHGYLCKFSIGVILHNERKLILDCSYGFSTDCEIGAWHSKPTLTHFHGPFFKSKSEQSISIGDDNVQGYIDAMYTELYKYKNKE